MTKVYIPNNILKRNYEHGFLKVSNIKYAFIPYSICVSSNDKNTYISLEGAKGITKNSMISELNKLVNNGIKDITEYINTIISYGFKYVIKQYDDNTFIYVCNKEYMECFNNIANINDIDNIKNNTYADLD